MTMTTVHAPELVVQSWFNVDRALSLSALRGRVVLITAFQVLCPNSLATAIPQAKRIFETFEPSDVTVIGLHATFEHHGAYNAELIKAFSTEYRLKFPIAWDSPNPGGGPIPQSMERLKMRGTPSIMLIDRLGMIRKHTFGSVDDLRLGAEIGALTQEAGMLSSLSRSSAA